MESSAEFVFNFNIHLKFLEKHSLKYNGLLLIAKYEDTKIKKISSKNGHNFFNLKTCLDFGNYIIRTLQFSNSANVISTNLRVYSESEFFVKHESSDKTASVLKSIYSQKDFFHSNNRPGFQKYLIDICPKMFAFVFDNNEDKTLKLLASKENTFAFEDDKREFIMKPG